MKDGKIQREASSAQSEIDNIVNQLVAKIEELEEENESLSNEIGDLQTQISELNDQIDELSLDLENTQSNYDELYNKCKGFDVWNWKSIEYESGIPNNKGMGDG